MLRDIRCIVRKELGGFFASPAAFLFLAAFLLATLFVFFWLDTFFARNIADVRPMFQWMPVLLIFLVAALTMRIWSEERRSGTLEGLLTSPVCPFSLVLGKFTAGFLLVLLALVLTLPLPITVACLGPLDWGPVWGGYIATLFLASAYLAIGQYMSGRTDNPVVALILTSVVCGAFYLVGSNTLTQFFGEHAANILRLIGTGSRFASITRGVVDLRDLYYYVSLIGVFLTLNLLSLERVRRAGNPPSRRQRRQVWGAILLAVNFLAANFWLAPVTRLRADLTSGRLYSLSQATRNTLAQAREPLVIKAYFSSQTHPLLAPLVPQLQDLLEEYAVAGGRNVQVQIINPQEDKDAAEEATAKYGVRPVPFQVASKYQAGVVSSYFDVVVAYGDQFEHLGFRDLIELKARGDDDLEVALRDPEYAITRAIRKVIAGYQSAGTPFARIKGNVVLHAYVSSPEHLPERVRSLRQDLASVLAEISHQSGGRFRGDFSDPDADGGKLAKTLSRKYGFQPEVAGLAESQPFWFYMVLEGSQGAQQIALPADLSRDGLKRNIMAALQRLGGNNLHTVALMTPQAGMAQTAGYASLRKTLEANARVIDTDLASGKVPDDVDLLMVMSPSGLSRRQVFAIDQFLMQGGSVVMATSPVAVNFGQTLSASPMHTGLEDWLSHIGIKIAPKLVLDRQSAALPVPSIQYVGGIPVREVQMLQYPPFIDARSGELDRKSPVTASMNQLTVGWASPISLTAGLRKRNGTEVLIQSSPHSWQAGTEAVLPDLKRFPNGGYSVPSRQASSTVAVALKGPFDSYFKGEPFPLAGPDASAPSASASSPEESPVSSVISHSPANARLVLVSSNSFASDVSLSLASDTLGTQYRAPLTFLQNAVDWSLEDGSLMALRGRTQFARTLLPMDPPQQRDWEILNDVLALLGLGVVWLIRKLLQRLRQRYYAEILKEVQA